MLFGDEHVRRYEETDGEVGHEWKEGVPTLVLTTTGRKTGQERKFALIYQEIEGDAVVVASKGGAPNHPGWYFNLVEHPEVGVQVGADRYRGPRPHGRRRGARQAVGRARRRLAGLQRVREEDRPRNPRGRARADLIRLL